LATNSSQPILSVQDLKTYYFQDEGVVRAVDGASFDLYAGKTLGIVGESGCGKSVTARSILRIVEETGRIEAGHIWLRVPGQPGQEQAVDLTTLNADGRQMRSIRGGEIGLIFQEPMTSFSVYHTVGNQIIEAIRLHNDVSKQEARNRAIELLRIVGIPHPERRIDEYSFQLSGGLRQRVMIAMTLMCGPDLIIADEPTTALDVTIQAQILLLLAELQKEFEMGLILITHDLGVVARVADRVAVMYAGQIVEQGTAKAVFENPSHPYTQGLLECIPIPGKTRRGQHLGSIPGIVPSLVGDLRGCRFAERCDHAQPGCSADDVALGRRGEEDHLYRCVLTPEQCAANLNAMVPA
jgi:peptide/nickel transport system ATP-binding protein